MTKLTNKQQMFVLEYLKDMNATQAAKRAGYSKHTAMTIGGENLRKPQIQAEIRKAMDARAERTRVSIDKVVTELAKLGFSDWRELGMWSDDGMELIPSEEVEDEPAAAVKDVSMTKERRYDRNGELIETTHTKLSLHDKKGALELLGRHLGMFKDNLNIETKRPLVVKVRGLGAEVGKDDSSGSS